MGVIFLLALCPIVLHHFYYHYLDGRSPSNSAIKSFCIKGCSNELRNQTLVSDIGISLAYASQTLLATVIVIAAMQVFWRRMRSRPIRISQIDALMNIRTNPFSPSFFRAVRASFSLIFLAMLAFSMSLLSVFVPGAIKISDDFVTSKQCTVQKPRNLTAVNVFNNTQSNSSTLSYTTPIITVLSSGSYLPPLNPCNEDISDGPIQCEYIIDFTAPGFDCADVTATSNSSGFTTPFIFQNSSDTFLFQASQPPQIGDLEMQVSVQTYDFKRAVYQAVNCTGVLRQYSTIVSHNTSSTIDAFESSIISTIQANASQLVTFPATYINDIISTLAGIDVEMIGNSGGRGSGISMTPIMMGNIGTFGLDGNMTWRDNMTIALEEFAQNATLSFLSGQIFSFDPEDPDLLESTTTTCTYTFTAYKYSPYRLFVPYGVAVLVTILCIIWGWSAIRRNGVEESMDFSRFLRAVLNERMYEAREYLDKNTKVRSEDTVEGDLAPISSNY
ncbi:hypothetical protein SCHPADRAFT_320477 [Schizopora paradoxa]|uniref:Uncharacterized protein n=1 Tax=Schizopora paradoxa TaxID=27342 RepID=A0A0H2SBS9_9AGAM|nr:hypothetical protein SCHPADRAFT_320477 [Schizopora paradoxa]